MMRRLKKNFAIVLALALVITIITPTKQVGAAIADTDVCSINGTGYATIAAAMTAANADSVIVMEKNVSFTVSTDKVEVNKTCTFNINGKTLTSVASEGVFNIKSGGNLTIMDSAGGGVVQGTTCAAKLNSTNITLTIYGGKFVCTSGSSALINATTNVTGDILNVYGGTFVNTTGASKKIISTSIPTVNYYCDNTTSNIGATTQMTTVFNYSKLVTKLTTDGKSFSDVFNTLGAQYKEGSGYANPNAIRFGNEIKKTLISSAGSDVKYGMLVAIASKMSAAGVTELTADNIALYGKDIVSDKIYSTTATALVFSAAIVNIPDSQKDTAITARAYIKVGSTYTYLDQITKTYNEIVSQTTGYAK